MINHHAEVMLYPIAMSLMRQARKSRACQDTRPSSWPCREAAHSSPGTCAMRFARLGHIVGTFLLRKHYRRRRPRASRARMMLIRALTVAKLFSRDNVASEAEPAVWCHISLHRHMTDFSPARHGISCHKLSPLVHRPSRRITTSARAIRPLGLRVGRRAPEDNDITRYA